MNFYTLLTCSNAYKGTNISLNGCQNKKENWCDALNWGKYATQIGGLSPKDKGLRVATCIMYI